MIKRIKNYLKNNYLLILILILALFLRARYITWGLPNEFHPYSYHPDEARHLYAAAQMNLAELDFNPDDFVYPSFNYYTVALALKIANLFGFVKLIPSIEYYVDNTAEFARLFLVGRLVTVIYSVLTVFLVYLIGKKIFNKKAGLLASAILTIIPLHVIESHYLAVDVPTTFWVTLVILLSLYLFSSKGLIFYILAGLITGIATATKYPALLVFSSVIAAHLISAKQIKKIFDYKIFLSCIFVLIGLFIGCPYCFFDFNNFKADLTTEFSGKFIEENRPLFVKTLLSDLPFILGLPLYILLMFSIINIIKSKVRLKENLILYTPLILFIILFGTAQVNFLRYYLPLLPIFSVISSSWIYNKKYVNKFLKVAIIIVLAYTSLFTLTFLAKFDDTTDHAYIWIFDNVKENETLAVTLWAPLRYTPLLDKEAFGGTFVNEEVILAKRLNYDKATPTEVCYKKSCKKYKVITFFNPSESLLDSHNPNYIIISSLEYANYQIGAGKLAFYQKLRDGKMHGYKLVKTFHKPYLNEAVYTKLDKSFVSYYPSPKLEFYQNVG